MRVEKLLVAVIAPSLFACVTESMDDSIESDVAAEESPDLDESEAGPVAQQQLCVLPPPAPPPDRSWFLSSTNTYDTATVDPANGECDDYVIQAHNVERFVVSIGAPADTAEKCVGTQLNIQKYRRNGTTGEWSTVDSTSSATGVWTYPGTCILPSVSWTAHTTDYARIRITSRRTYTSGQFTVTQRGLLFGSSGTVYEPSVPSIASPDETELTPSTTVTAQALQFCTIPPTAPAPDYTHDFATSVTPRTLYVSNYGSTACSNYVAHLDNGGYPGYENGKMMVSMALPTTADACIATVVRVREYDADDGSIETTTTRAQWTATGCKLPSVQVYAVWRSVTAVVSAHREQYCPSGGPYCAAAVYGLPFTLRFEEV